MRLFSTYAYFLSAPNLYRDISGRDMVTNWILVSKVSAYGQVYSVTWLMNLDLCSML